MEEPPERRSTFVDLSHPLRDGMAVSPGLPRPRIEPFLSHAASRPRYSGMAEFEITRLFLVGNTGTSIDSPHHRYAGRPDVGALPLARLVGLPGACFRARRPAHSSERAVGAGGDLGSLTGHAVLLRTGWDRRWGSDAYWADSPFLDLLLVERLVRARPALVGVDFANVDDPSNHSRPAHSTLLDAGIPILENLRGLDALPERGFRLYAAPVAVDGAAALPVRVFAELGGARAIGSI